MIRKKFKMILERIKTIMEYMISDLRMNEMDGYRFIEWRTRSDFEYQAEIGDAIQIVSKTNVCYKGVIADFDESGLHLRVNARIGSPQVHIMYKDVIDIK
jgi:hypothetical protein